MVAANFASEALNGGQVQLPKLRTRGGGAKDPKKEGRDGARVYTS